MKNIIISALCLSLLSGTYGINEAFGAGQNVVSTPADDPATWQEQLEYAKRKADTKSGAAGDFDELFLESYECLGTISTENEKKAVIERIFADSSYMARQSERLKIDMRTIGELRRADSSFSQWVENSKLYMERYFPARVEVVSLRWNYKGRIYYSLAMASNEHGGVLYENIGYTVIDPDSL